LPELGSAFSSYTYTDVSAGFFERAQKRFEKFDDRMVYKTFDMEKAPEDQGFSEGYYDVVLASNVLHATGRLDEMMSNVRRLLKPGGYLVVLEIISNEFLGIGCAMGGLPGWWAGAERDKQRLSGPTLTLPQWDNLTRRNGFGGVETATPPMHKLHPYSVFAAQAVDDRVSILRSPLLDPAPSVSDHLTIVGGKTFEVHRLAGLLSTLLRTRYSTITRLDTLEEVHDKRLPHLSSVVSLTELDEQFLETRTSSKLEALRSLWRSGGSILWVTRSVRDETPYSSMILGLSRAMRFEYPNINLQMLDIDVVGPQTAHALAESLIRLELLGRWKEDPDSGARFLWSLEPELIFKNDRLLIPRMYPHSKANGRYNTYRRTVREEVGLRETTVALASNGPSYELQSVSPLRLRETNHFDGRRRTFHISHSVLPMIRIGQSGFFMLVAGTDTDTGEHLVAVSDSAQSPASTLAEWSIPVTSPPPVQTLALVAAQLVARSLHALAPRSGTILIHEAGPALAHAIAEEFEQAQVGVQFVSTKRASMKGCAVVHPNLPLRLIERIIPHDVSLFVNLARETGAVVVGESIAKSLPRYTPVATASDFVRPEPTASPGASAEQIQNELVITWKSALQRHTDPSHDVPIMSLQDVESHSLVGEPLAVVDWNVSSSIQVSLQSIDTGTLFRGDGTHLLVGLSGQLGQSLCTWMVQHGARHVVLSSRRPVVHPKYIEMIESMGAEIRIMSMYAPLKLLMEKYVHTSVHQS